MKLSKLQLAALTALQSWDYNYFTARTADRRKIAGLHRTLLALNRKGLIEFGDGTMWVTQKGLEVIFARTVDAQS